MANLKLHVEGVGFIEGEPEALAVFAKSYKTQPMREKASNEENGAPEKGVPALSNVKFNFSVEDIVNYILTKKNYENDTTELQDKFLGKRVKATDDPVLFNSFHSMIKKARKEVESRFGITWDTTNTKSYDRRTHPTLYMVKTFGQPQKELELKLKDDNTEEIVKTTI